MLTFPSIGRQGPVFAQLEALLYIAQVQLLLGTAAARAGVLVLVLECTSCSCSSARALVLVTPSLVLFSSTPRHAGTRSSSTSASTSKSADPQQQHQQLECVACSSPCSCFLQHKQWLCNIVPVLCYDTCARGCVGACGSVCWNPTFQLLFFLVLLAAAAVYSYGHYLACVDHRYACLVMMYACMCCLCVLRVRTDTVQTNCTATLCGPII